MSKSNPFSKTKFPNCWVGHNYAEQVVAGEILACKFVIGACRRYLRELDDDVETYRFVPEKAEKFLRMVQKFEHVIGKWKTKNIVFEPWQCWVWMNIMGFIDTRTGFRRFRIAHIEVPRGNAKSAMASQAVLYFAFLDDPQGNQVATVATKRDQARIVLDSARAMADKNEAFKKQKGVRVLAHTMTQPKTNSIVRALSSDHTGLDGLNDVLAVCDELHAMKGDTFDVIYSGMSKRSDSLTLCITTAGSDVESVGHSQSAYAKQLCEGDLIDDQMFAVVYTTDEDDDIYDEKTWRKANPNWGISVDPISFAAKAEKTKHSPRDLPNFKIKHLDMWIQEAQAFFDTSLWDKCAAKNLSIDKFAKRNAKMGLDLASHLDITSYAAVFRDKIDVIDKDGNATKEDFYSVFTRNFIPEDTFNEVKTKNALYAKAVEDGDLIVTPGAAINYKSIRDDMLDYSKNFRVDECMYDTWNATETAQKLSNKIEMVKFAMNTANLSEPMKQFDALIRQGRVAHNGSPLIRWCLGNVVAKEDANENVFPRKNHKSLKIDPIVAILMALAGWLQTEEKVSVYEERGIRAF